MESTATVLEEQPAEHVRTVVLNQPGKKNAIDAAMTDRVREVLVAADDDPDVHVVVLRGAGENFSSGGDLSQGAGDGGIETARAQLRHYLRLIRTVREIGVPVISMVDGYAVGGAFSLMLAGDLICASTRTRVIPAFCALGIAPEMGITRFLPMLVGEKAAKEILFTNRTLTGEDLGRLGIATRVLAPQELEHGTLELARQVAAMPPMSIQITKGLMNATLDVGLAGVLEAEATASPFATRTRGHAQAMADLGRGRR